MTYQIDKNIPIPEINQANNVKYPWSDMEVGDSFFCWSKSVKAAASSHKKRTGMCFTVRSEGDGYRVWRTS